MHFFGLWIIGDTEMYFCAFMVSCYNSFYQIFLSFFFSLEAAGKDECEEAVFDVKILLETKIRY